MEADSAVSWKHMCVWCMSDFGFIVIIAQLNLFIKVNLLHIVSENIICNGMSHVYESTTLIPPNSESTNVKNVANASSRKGTSIVTWNFIIHNQLLMKLQSNHWRQQVTKIIFMVHKNHFKRGAQEDQIKARSNMRIYPMGWQIQKTHIMEWWSIPRDFLPTRPTE